MSRLHELVRELCPDGVEYKALGEITTCFDSMRKPVTKSARVAGEYPYYGASGIQDYVAEYIFDGTYVLVGEDGSVIDAHNHPVVNWVEGRFWCNNHAHILQACDGLELKYFYYALQNTDVRLIVRGTPPKLNRKNLDGIRIPVPPIEVQREVVRILDECTAAHDELVRQLDEEIHLREQELSTARNGLLTFGNDVEWSTLGDIMTIERGASPRPIKKFVTDSEDGVPWIKIGDVDTGGKYITTTAEHITQAGAEKSRFLSAGSFVLSNSMSYGRPYILKIDGCIHDGWLSLREYDHVYDTDFLYYLLRSDLVQHYWDSKVNSSSVSNLNSDLVKKTPVPIPPMEMQRQIASKLDLMADPFAQIVEVLDEQLTLENAQLALVLNQLLSFPEKVA